jgi:ABC-type antimicrobial peptide transport system permease subunit
MHQEHAAFMVSQRNTDGCGKTLDVPYLVSNSVPAEEIAQNNARHSFPLTLQLCLAGMRFGLMQTKVGLVSLLSKHQFSVSKRTSIPLVFDKKSFILAPVVGMWCSLRSA